MDSTIVILTEKVEKAIIALGNGIGKSAEYVYPIIVRQQIIHGLIPLLILIPSLIITFISLKKIKGWDDSRDPNPEHACNHYNVVFVVFAVISIISFLVFVINSGMIINSEYYALREIVGMIK